MDPGKIFQIITNSTLLATRLLSRAGDGPLQFSEPRYCLLLAEDAPPTLRLAQVTASHKDGLGVRYSIRAGNRDGLFTIDQRSGLITLAAPLDYELRAKHELLVAAEAAGHTVHVMVHVAVVDVNDNPPHFLEEDLRAAVIEEDDIHLPAIIAKVEARDLDALDKEGLVYSVGGDGVEGLSPGDAFFTINPHTGELLQLRALDRDPPLGRDTWKVRVQVRDGQRVSPSLAAVSRASRRPRVTEGQHDQPQDSGAPQGPSASSSRGPNVAAEEHSVMPEDLSVPIPDGHSPLLHESKSAGNQQSFLQDSSTSGNLYSPSQDPTLPPCDAMLRKGKEEEEKEEEEEEKEGEDQGKSSNVKGKLIHRMEEENKTGKTSGKGQEWKISTPSTLVQKENDDIIHKKKTSEQRQLGDEDHRNAKGDMTPVTGRGKRSTDENGIPEPPDVLSRSSHTSRILGRNPLQRFTRLRRDDTEGSGLECDPESRKTIHTKVTLEPPMPSRLKLITRAKHKHTGSQRGLPTLGNMMKRRPLERGLRGKTHTAEGSLSTDVILSKPEYFPDDTLPHATELPVKETEDVVISPHRGSTSQHISKPSPPTDSESHNGHEEPREREHKPPQHLSESTAPTMYSGDVHDLSSGSSDEGVEEESVEAEAMRVTKNKREVPQKKRRLLPAASRSALKQVSQDPRYVRRLKAVGGECQDDGGVFATSSEEIHRERPHVLDMRRARVHVAETVVTVVVKDVNDNAPVFPNVTIYGEVQENGPIDQSAGVVWAWDADDQQEGTNAHLTYSIEKNVVEDHSGQAIFTVHPETGLVRTAVCCLDRETTPEYHIQVVATDGGGLKGTGTVVVRLTDVNDNSPRLTRDLWQVGVDETWGLGPPGNDTLLQVTTDDQDTSNYFFYRVVEGSGWGWQHFGMRTHGRVGQLFARMTLDHEDPAHRRGFHFMIQVTDKGRGGWSDARHTDTAWVEVQLQDVNDNPPQFLRPFAHVTVREDAAPGTLLARLPATDPDMMNQQQVHYYVEGGWGSLSVDESGEVRLWRALDREAPGGEVSTAWVVAVDEGHPSLSSTATLTITVTDVNDCPPRLLPPTLLHVAEGAPASLLGLLTATDDDVWALAHGPPFNFTLAPSNPDHVLNTLSIKFDPNLDSRRGGAEVWTVGPMDREEHRQLMAEVVVADAGGLAATQPVTIVIDDINDNPMKPATKTIYLWKTQGRVVDAAIGRVYVEDPDDWDLQDKTFMWSGPPHPLFTLQPNTGDIFASTLIREGRYDLHFRVSDRVWDQYVEAKVTVNVKYLSPEALAHAIPLTLTPTTPAALASGWTPAHGGGGLGTLTEAVMQVLGRPAEAVEIISVYGLPTPNTTSVPTFSRTSSTDSILAAKASPAAPSLACVWLSVKQMGGGFMDPVRLYGLLAIHLHHLEKMMKLRVALEDVHTLKGEAEELVAVSSEPDNAFPHNPSSVASLASVALPLQVVDTNLTSLVTPRLTRAHSCNTHKHYGDEVCTATSCLNGGRCLGMDAGNRCVCPEGSWGHKCKVLTRTFTGSGWAWVQPIPPCIPTTLSIRILSHRPQALLLYSGPLSSTSSHPHNPSTPMIALQLVNGQPQAVLEGARGAVKVQVNVTLSTSTWHTLHLHLDAQGVTLMVDLCGHGWTADTTNDAHCIARAQWVDTEVSKSWGGSVPLQLGGLAQPYPLPGDFGWSATLVHQALDGCLSHLTVNGELIDLGESAYSSKSVSGCRPQEIACRERQTSCGLRGHCVNGLKNPRCECQPGWSGPKCTIPTVPVAFGQASYTKVALSFTPDPFDVTLQLRIRTRGNHNGLLMQLASNQQSHALKLQLRGGVACASVYGVELAVQEVCLESFPLGDGLWHTIQVGRHGHNLIISVDDGDGWRQNNTLASLFTTLGLRGMQAVTAVPPMPINVDKQDGTTLGGVPEFKGLSLITVYEDLQESCVDDVRVSGHSLPLPPSLNGTIWGQVTIQQNLEQGCNAPNMCNTTNCLPPLSCHDSWRLATCSCAPGQQLVNISCQDINECVFQPCLNGGTCYNLRPAYHCACDPAHIGDNCEWVKVPMKPNPLTAPMAITAITLSMIVIMVIGILLTIRIHRSRAARTIGLSPASMEGVRDAIEDSETVQGVTNSHENKEGNTFLQSLRSKVPNKQIFLSPKGTKVLVTPVGLSTLGCEAVTTKRVSPLMARSTTKIPGSKVLKGHDETNVEICSTAAVDIAAENVDFDQKRNIAWIKCSKTICSTSECPVAACSTIMCSQTTNKMQQVNIGSCMNSVQPLLANNDLRAYAYEGDSMPYGSLNSTVLGHSNTS
ncbi:putative neural-cadherin 2 [Panulirus ornatus]|uniref:putative neural-cadherin 2 n=1 Tax=Panulirus ornatus TaxID=150431 RepID=UPI003A84522F